MQHQVPRLMWPPSSGNWAWRPGIGAWDSKMNNILLCYGQRGLVILLPTASSPYQHRNFLYQLHIILVETRSREIGWGLGWGLGEGFVAGHRCAGLGKEGPKVFSHREARWRAFHHSLFHPTLFHCPQGQKRGHSSHAQGLATHAPGLYTYTHSMALLYAVFLPQPLSYVK